MTKTTEKKHWDVILDVQTTYKCRVEAYNIIAAEDEAIELAYHDTWGSESTFNSASMSYIKRVTPTGLPFVSYEDMSDSELLTHIKEIMGCENNTHLINHVNKAEDVYQESK